VVMLTGIERKEDISGIAYKALDAIAKPFVIYNYELFVSASIGISIYPKDGNDEQALLKNADIAMYRAKEGGKNRFEFYTDVMNSAAMRRLQLEGQLQQALERNELILHYQPQASLQTGHIIGVEVLVRWMHPTLGLIPPNEFIPICEETGLILPIGEWILETACRQAVEWQDAGVGPLRIAVNLSGRQFSKPGLATTVMQILDKTGLEPSLLELELTESIFMQGTDEVIAILQSLRKLGVSLSVDDFGTGYSSLSYLRRFPMTAVKIDQSFVKSITSDADAAGLVRSIISMAHELRLSVIAEGVETEGQLAFLTNHACDEVQGYFLSRPLPAIDCLSLLRQFSGLPPRSSAQQTLEQVLLIVDTEVSITTALKRVLRSEGYCIFTATSAGQGLELLAIHRVGVIISDQHMPEMTGVDFLRRVKSLYPDTVRIVLSGYTDLQSITDAINEGAIYKFLTKPWEDEQLRDNVREAFHYYEMKYENTRLTLEVEQVNNELSKINGELKQRVLDKAQEAHLSSNALHVSYEILENLPVAVIGADEDGLIVISNRRAELLFNDDTNAPLLGSSVHARLPEALTNCLVNPENSFHIVTLNAGIQASIICHRMDNQYGSKGYIFVVST
ncbi:MAG: EAL domain-containing protein, partial [Gammaproteobacteria bacterium]|nr:EAL domain-containing protein [Gammaproteobacteria bacterium]